MAKSTELRQLTEVFKQAGAQNPELWAASQLDEGINQLGRFSFLKAISSTILKEDETGWVDSQLSNGFPNSDIPGSQIVAALKEMVEKSVSKEAIIDLIRVIQWETLAHVCATIDGIYELETPISKWGLFQLDDDYNPSEQISGLNESLLEFDPSGKEMRPRNSEASR